MRKLFALGLMLATAIGGFIFHSRFSIDGLENVVVRRREGFIGGGGQANHLGALYLVNYLRQRDEVLEKAQESS